MIQQLISHGHRESEISGYTIAKANAYAKAIEENDKFRRFDLLMVIRASQAEGEDFEKFSKKLLE